MYIKKDDRYALYWAKKIKAIRMMGGKCIKCGNDNIYVMDFHHIDKGKDFILGKNMGLMWEMIEKEANKCQLFCSNCHLEEHFKLGRASACKADILKQLGIDKCCRCGYRGENFNSLSFHHRDASSKEFNVSNYFARQEGSSVERLFEEIAKCDVICRNCHRFDHIDIEKVERLMGSIEYKITNHESRPRLDKSMVKKLKDEGKGICEIARILGYGKSTIHYIFHRV